MATQPLDTPAELGLPTGVWTLAADGSQIGFAVKTMWGLVDVRGRFTRFDGGLRVAPEAASAQLSIDAASLDTGHKKRDEHLRSPDFFDVEQHPRLTFTATAITPRAGDGLTIAGDLVLGAQTARVQFPVEVRRGEQGRLHLSAATSISREQAGMSWNRAGMIRGDARLTLELELTPAQDSAERSPDVAADVA